MSETDGADVDKDIRQELLADALALAEAPRRTRRTAANAMYCCLPDDDFRADLWDALTGEHPTADLQKIADRYQFREE